MNIHPSRSDESHAVSELPLRVVAVSLALMLEVQCLAMAGNLLGHATVDHEVDHDGGEAGHPSMAAGPNGVAFRLLVGLRRAVSFGAVALATGLLDELDGINACIAGAGF